MEPGHRSGSPIDADSRRSSGVGWRTPLRAQCERLLQSVAPRVSEVHLAIAQVTDGNAKGCPTVAMCPELYRDEYLISDIISYRAAAIVAAHFEPLHHRFLQTRVTASPAFTTLKQLATSHGGSLTVAVSPPPTQPGHDSNLTPLNRRALADLRNWRRLLSPTGHSYRSLDRTLMNLPPSVPGDLVCRLASVELPRPITDPLELLVLTLFLSLRQQTAGHATAQVFSHARASQIQEALRKVAAHTRNDLRSTRLPDLRLFVRFLLDFPGPHDGTIVGLARKAIRWHQRRLAHERAEIVERYGATTRVAVPSIPPPADEGVHLLETVEEIAREGQEMNHCIASYIPDALRGLHYIFHVQHDGAAATVMVDRAGKIADAQGPRNRRNAASRWGDRRLTAWARELSAKGVEQAC